MILDVSNPAEVKELSAFDEGLTGGEHNVFIYQDHVYAINNSRRYDVIDISDPAVPNRVGQFELDTPGTPYTTFGSLMGLPILQIGMMAFSW